MAFGLPHIDRTEITMPMTEIDHLVITAPTLAAGAVYIERRLGTALSPGGQHPRMGTHNLLLRLGERLYLEVIAINPNAPPPGLPRWFALDRLVATSTPSLVAWVARTTDINHHASNASEPLGVVTGMQRGERRWRITIPADGEPVLAGAAPSLIEWEGTEHPAEILPDNGLTLASLKLLHPEPHRLALLFDSIELSEPLKIRLIGDRQPGLVATINLPSGRQATLRSA